MRGDPADTSVLTLPTCCLFLFKPPLFSNIVHDNDHTGKLQADSCIQRRETRSGVLVPAVSVAKKFRPLRQQPETLHLMTKPGKRCIRLRPE